MSASICEVISLLTLLQYFNIDHVGSVELRCDNQFTLSLSKNPIFHHKTMHVELDVHFIREKVASGVLALIYVEITDQLENLFTKALPSPQLYNLLGKMILLDILSLQTHLEWECE